VKRQVVLAVVAASTLLATNPQFATGTADVASASPAKLNRFDPTTQAQSVSVPKTAVPSPAIPAPTPTPAQLLHPAPPAMSPATLTLDPNNAAQFVGSDGGLQVDVPAGAVTSSDVAAAGGQLGLLIRQIAPASGGNAGGSGHATLGTFLLQVVDATGRLASVGLRQPVTLSFHLGPHERALDWRYGFVTLNGGLPLGVSLNPDRAGITMTATDAHLGGTSSQPLTAVPAQPMVQTTASLNSPSTAASFNTNSPIASFGRPDPFNVDLSAGSLMASYPIDAPNGPGGLTPPLKLIYSSAAVAEQHSPQAAAPWVGEGWNLSLGSISWAEHNVASGCQALGTCTSPNWNDSWQLNDAYGTAAELIPPNVGVTTSNDSRNGAITPSPLTWHTAPESHAKVISYAPSSLASDPAAVSWGTNRVDAFIRCQAQSESAQIPSVSKCSTGDEKLTDPRFQTAQTGRLGG
jgi:hypothetical protein